MLGFAAVNTGNNLIFLIVSALLGFMVVSGLMGMVNLHGLVVQVDLAEEIYAGNETLATITLKNDKRYFPSFLVRISLFNSEAFVTFVERSGSTKSWSHISFDKRGLVSHPVVGVSSPFPINFFVRGREAEIPVDLIIFPRPLPCTAEDIASSLPANEYASFRGKGYDGELDRIVDYSGSEPLKLIHWRLSARQEEWKVRALTGIGADPVTIVVDDLPGKNGDQQVSCAAYLVNSFMQKGQPVGLRMRSVVIPPELSKRHRLKLLSELACYDKD